MAADHRVYDEPLYYEIAFSFVDAAKQCDLFEEFIERYSLVPVRRVLDIACGPSLQLRELARRGYSAVGLDRSRRMLDYLEARAEEDGLTVETVEADMTDFGLGMRADFAFILMGSIGLIGSKEEFLSHLSSVASSLRSGGLYLMENMRLNWHSPQFFGEQNWLMEREGIKVETTYRVELKDALAQKLTEMIRLEVDQGGNRLTFEETTETRMIFPQEFLTLMELEGSFEFVGWFERGSTERITSAEQDNIVLLRRL